MGDLADLQEAMAALVAAVGALATSVHVFDTKLNTFSVKVNKLVLLVPETAAVRLQAATRGFFARRRAQVRCATRKEREQWWCCGCRKQCAASLRGAGRRRRCYSCMRQRTSPV
jgi:hypothetical protein